MSEEGKERNGVERRLGILINNVDLWGLRDADPGGELQQGALQYSVPAAAEGGEALPQR